MRRKTIWSVAVATKAFEPSSVHEETILRKAGKSYMRVSVIYPKLAGWLISWKIP